MSTAPHTPLNLNDPAPHRNRHRLSPVAGAKLFHDVLDMHFDCLFRDEEPPGNILVPVATRDMTQHLEFTLG